MKFEEIIPELRTDKKARRSSWGEGYHIALRGESSRGGELLWWDGSQYYNYYALSRDDLNADDWEIVKETKRVKLRDLTEEQFKKWQRKNCSDGICICSDCVFTRVNCFSKDRCWIKDKSLFSDKFLDQEVEIED